MMDDNNISVETVTYCATPILYLNMGGEMLYVLQQRLQTQKINPDKATQVINEVTYALLSPKQLHVVFGRGPLLGLGWLRTSLERVVLSSIMKLDENSMNKLFDLMIMMVKYQLKTATGPREVILMTLNHLDSLREMLGERRLREHVDLAHRLLVETYGGMTYKEIWQVRCDCARELEGHCVRVSVLLRLGMQNEDTSFNRLIQRYDEKYQERREVLEHFKLLDYQEDEGVAGSLGFNGPRVTLLGKNVYSPTFGLVSNSSSAQSLGQLGCSGASNREARREIESLASQLGKEEPLPIRPFSLRLFGHDDHGNMDSGPDRSRLDDNRRAEPPLADEQGNEISKEQQGADSQVLGYRDKLIKDIQSDFPDETEPSRTRDIDIMNMFNVI